MINAPDSPSLPSRTSLDWGKWLCGLALFLMPLGHLPLQGAYGLLCLAFLLRFNELRACFRQPHLTPLLWAVCLYVAICMFGSWGAGFEGGLWSASRLREHLIVFIYVAILTPLSQQSRVQLSAMMLLGGVLGVCVAWVQFIDGTAPLADWLQIPLKQRVILHPALPPHLAGTGLFYDRIAFSLVSVMLGVFGFSMSFQKQEKPMRRLVWAMIALMLLIGPGLAGSRMGLLLALIGVLAVLFQAMWKSLRPQRAVGLGAVLLITLWVSLSTGPLSKFDGNASSHLERNMDRVFIWQRAVEIFVDHPLFGTGYGHYPKVAPMVYHTSDPWRPEKNHAHNLLLTLLAETGMIGFFAFIFLWYQWGRAFWRRRKNELAISAFGSCMVFLAASSVHDPWFHSSLIAVFWWFAALACVAEPQENKK